MPSRQNSDPWREEGRFVASLPVAPVDKLPRIGNNVGPSPDTNDSAHDLYLDPVQGIHFDSDGLPVSAKQSDIGPQSSLSPEQFDLVHRTANWISLLSRRGRASYSEDDTSSRGTYSDHRDGSEFTASLGDDLRRAAGTASIGSRQSLKDPDDFPDNQAPQQNHFLARQVYSDYEDFAPAPKRGYIGCADVDITPAAPKPVLPASEKPTGAPDFDLPRLNGPSVRYPFRKPRIDQVHDPEDRIQAAQTQAATKEVGKDPLSSFVEDEKLDVDAYGYTTTRAHLASRVLSTPEEIEKGKRLWSITKFTFMACQISINFLFIFSTWWWSQYFYILLPFITITVALNCAMVVSVIGHRLFRLIKPEKKFMPPSPETMVYILPCYNETYEECTKSLESLVDQEGIDQHQKAVIIVVDGKVRSKGMEKTCADTFLDDILTERTLRVNIENAYDAWDTHPMDLTLQIGTYKGLKYACIVKHRNQGKRDSLILVRSFLYKYNTRFERPRTIFSSQLFGELARFLERDAGIRDVVHLIGMDADTVFAPDCIAQLLPESRYKNTYGVCGYVAVDFSQGPWDIWSLYQSAEYTISQGLRRLHQSVATHKVSCLPGCCQLLRICEETCGDEVLMRLFGYYPFPTDGMLKQIRATASEDRNHVCLMLSARPIVQTRQALRAKAFTDVPHSWSVFLSQRRRWTLGATSNDLYLITARGVNPFERVLALANVVTWFLNLFILASIASFIVACLSVSYWVILAFAAVMIVPMIYYVCIVFWLPQTLRERIQYILGLLCYVFLGPFLNIAVLCYALWNMDNFGWGKTRKIVKEDPDPSANATLEKAARRRDSLVQQADPAAKAWDEEARVGAPAPGVHRPSLY